MSPKPKLTISTTEYPLNNGAKGTLAVLVYTGSENPKPILDAAVRDYVGTEGYYELVDANMDNPWMRVILNAINEIEQVPFDPAKHKLPAITSGHDL